MKSSTEFELFCQKLVGKRWTQAQNAVACLWFEDHFCRGAELSASELAFKLESTGLATGTVNASRLRSSLRSSPLVARGDRRARAFRIAAARRPELDEVLLPLLKRPIVIVSDTILSAEIVKGTRPYLEKIAQQVNGCYDYRFYDGCAVMCRRMVESLLISAFEKAGHRQAIEDANGNLVGLDDLIGKAKSGKYIKLGRTSAKILNQVKEAGDTAAHHQHHITAEQDIAEFRPGFRKLVSELLALAGIQVRS